MNDEIAEARMQLLKMHLVVNDLRVRYWMIAAFGIVGCVACLGAAVWGCLGIAGRITATQAHDPGEMIIIGGLGLAGVVWFMASRMMVIGTLVTAMRQHIDHLGKATERAEDTAIQELACPSGNA